MTDPYTIGRQLGAEGRDKIVYEARKKGASGAAVALAQFKTASRHVQDCLRRSGTAKSKGKIRAEADYQSAAAAVGLAPSLIEVDLERSRLVMPILSGGTLTDVARAQGGTLTLTQQSRIIEILQRLGAASAHGGAALLHNDCGNSANFLADSHGRFYVIDFGCAKVRSAPLSSQSRARLLSPTLSPPLSRLCPLASASPQDIGTSHPDSNLHALYFLLYDCQQGLLTHRILKRPPTLLVDEYRAFVARAAAAAQVNVQPLPVPVPLPVGAGSMGRLRTTTGRARDAGSTQVGGPRVGDPRVGGLRVGGSRQVGGPRVGGRAPPAAPVMNITTDSESDGEEGNGDEHNDNGEELVTPGSAQCTREPRAHTITRWLSAAAYGSLLKGLKGAMCAALLSALLSTLLGGWIRLSSSGWLVW